MQQNNGMDLDIIEPGQPAEQLQPGPQQDSQPQQPETKTRKQPKIKEPVPDTHEARVETLLKKQLRWTRVCGIALALMLTIIIVLAAAVIPDVVIIGQTVKKIDVIADNINELSGELKSQDVKDIATNLRIVSENLSEINWSEIVTDIDKVVITAETGIAEATKSIEELDIETLNSAIADLNEVVKPLAKLVGAFS